MKRFGLDPSPLLDVGHRRLLELGRTPSARELAEYFGVSRREVVRWRNGQHGIRLGLADRLAARCGTHIDLLWPDLTDMQGVAW